MKTVLTIRHVAFEDLDAFTPVLAERGYAVRYLEAGYDDLAALEHLVTTQMAARQDVTRAARAEHTRLQAQAIRSLMQRLAAKPGSDALAEHFQ